MRHIITFLVVACQITFAQTPPTGSGTPATTIAAQQTFRFIGNDANGFADISRIYFLVNTTSTMSANVCHGFYDRALNGFYLYNDSLSVLQGPLAGGGCQTVNVPCTSAERR